MTVDPVVAGVVGTVAVVALICVGYLAAVVVIAKIVAARVRPYECEVCGDELTEKAARHLVAVHDNGDIGEQGGWAMTATYCRKHYPAK